MTPLARGGPQALQHKHRPPQCGGAVVRHHVARGWAIVCQNGGPEGGSSVTTTTTASPGPSSPPPPPFAPPFNPGNNPIISPINPELNARVHDLCMALGITRHTSFRLVCSQPDISIQALSSRTSWLATELSLPAEEVALLQSKEPLLLSTPAAQLSATLTCLCELLGGLTKLEASRVIVFSPFLMAIEPASLQQQYTELQQVLGCTSAHLSSLLYQQPYMLSTPAAKVKRRFDEISTLLGIAIPQLVQLMSVYPPLCIQDPRNMKQRLEALCDVLQADVTQVVDMIIKFPPILMTHPDITAARLQLLADNLDLTPLSLAPLLLACPDLFSSPQNLLVSQFSKLFALFGNESKDRVLQLVTDNPSLLGLQSSQPQ